MKMDISVCSRTEERDLSLDRGRYFNVTSAGSEAHVTRWRIDLNAGIEMFTLKSRIALHRE